MISPSFAQIEGPWQVELAIGLWEQTILFIIRATLINVSNSWWDFDFFLSSWPDQYCTIGWIN